MADYDVTLDSDFIQQVQLAGLTRTAAKLEVEARGMPALHNEAIKLEEKVSVLYEDLDLTSLEEIAELIQTTAELRRRLQACQPEGVQLAA